ncbi:MAG: hypothetical protein CVU05_00900 [Bacteroidetes bacterium HGW-Bacteroidetes-21]|nr:MAG: hypothetical protein CVU05_00900 [Bacteroidetes bacterium HGW-Bacteroidetes-21]
MKKTVLLACLFLFIFSPILKSQEETIQGIQVKKSVIKEEIETNPSIIVKDIRSEDLTPTRIKTDEIIIQENSSREKSTSIPDSSITINEKIITNHLKGIPLSYSNIKSGEEENGTKAAPANDAICSATTIAVNGTCLDNQTNIDATSDYYGGCVLSGSPSVFYKFTITAPNNMITISLNDFSSLGRQLYLYLMNGLCTSPNAINAECTTTTATPLSFSFYNLSPGTYYLMVATQPGVGNMLSRFDICATQAIAPPLITGPEQDCFGAIAVCDHTYIQNVSYTGFWDTQEITTGFTCLYGGENNSVWYVFTPQTSGNLAFMIQTTKDYDWALYNLTAIGGCANVPGATPVLCNYSGTLGNTGTTLPVNATIPRSVNDLGLPTMAGIPVVAGTTYALIIDNYTADINGYTLSFDISAGSASIADNPPATGAYPSMSSASASCTANTITINMSEGVECLSINPNNFTLTNTSTGVNFTSAITQITGVNCSSGGLTTQLLITHNGTLTTGVYQISVNAGATLTDKCGNLIQPGGTVSFSYLAALTLTSSANNICGGETISLDANGADGTPSVTTYNLNPGGLTNTTNGVFAGLSPTVTTTYTVSATFGGCTRTANVTVNVEGNIVTSINPTNQTVCSFPTSLSASTNINGTACVGCTYLWSTGQTTPSISVTTAGTYYVTATTVNGCHNFNSPSSIISVAGTGTGGGTCDVIYVSPAGGGTGYTKLSPTTLANAVINARCTNTIIKMQKGTYTLTNCQAVPSYITIEGGFDALYETKSSNLTGGANSTTIRRTNSKDVIGGITFNTCTALLVEDGAKQFRIQDIRIELPGSAFVTGHAAGAGVINYGIKLGTTCSDYNIVRCYIDAGVGAAP